MNDAIQPGLRGEKRMVVGDEHAITFMPADVPRVLASPWMLMFMEHAARESLLPFLEPGTDTVGVGFEFEHLAAAPLGAAVVATSELLAIDGRRFRFRIECRDAFEVIGRGFHVRALVDIGKFKERMRTKLEPKSPNR